MPFNKGISMASDHRLIGTFSHSLPGPLVVVTAAIHGNEPAGVRALESVFEQLERECHTTGQPFRGKLVGLIGNQKAFEEALRFVDRDLNRIWTDEHAAAIRGETPLPDAHEFVEARQLYRHIAEACKGWAGPVVFLDIHTTSAEGGVFCIPTDESESLRFAQHLGAPAIVGLQQNIEGTLLGFAANGHFGPKKPLCAAFEAGQHRSRHAVARAAIAVVRCLRYMGNLSETALSDFTGRLSLPLLSNVPPVVRFRYAHAIKAEDGFRMRPGYTNFQPVHVGEHLADDVHGPVLSPEQGMILMPLYQPKGSDGFFIVQ
jgi:succinylglutamate desuccinylase